MVLPMPDSVLSESEQRFLRELNARGVRMIVVGMSAALLQGARGATEDIDLWFARPDDPGIGAAAEAAGGFYISGNFGMRPPGLGGKGLGDRFDVVMHLDGLASFEQEWSGAERIDVEGVPLHVLPLARVLASKRAANRPKDLAQIPALEEALAVRAGGSDR